MARRTFLLRCRTMWNDCLDQLLKQDVGPAVLQAALRRLDTMQRTLLWSKGRLIDVTGADQLLNTLVELIQEIRSIVQRNYQGCVGCQAPQALGRGRTRHLVSQEQLLFLTSCALTAHQMAEILNVSVSTIRSRLRQFHLDRPSQYAALSDGALDELIERILGRNQQIGPEAIRAALQASGVRVQMWRIRASMLRVNPAAAALLDIVRRRLRVG